MRWQIEDHMLVDSETGVSLRPGFPAGELDESRASALVQRVAAGLNDDDTRRAARDAFRRVFRHTAPWAALFAALGFLMAGTAWPAVIPWLGALAASVLLGMAVGASAVWLALDGKRYGDERQRERTDLAIDTCMGAVFELDEITGEHKIWDFDNEPAIPDDVA